MQPSFALIVGQALGLKCLNTLLKTKKVNIKFIISSDKRYNSAFKSLCLINKIKFYTNFSEFMKKNNKNIFKESFLLSILSNIILDKKFLKKFKACFNLHPAILPEYPGLNPISGMIFNKEKKVGATLHQMTEKIDAGGIVSVKKILINSNDNLISCTKKIEKLSKKLLLELIHRISKNKTIKFKRNSLKKRKIFQKKIPNKGLLDLNWSLNDFTRHFNSGYSGPFKSEWGRIYFNYDKKKKIIFNFKRINNIKYNKIIQIKENIFNLKLKNISIQVQTQNAK